MNSSILKGFEDIRADKPLLEKAKKRMLNALQKPKARFPLKRLAFAAAPAAIALIFLTVMLGNSFFGSPFVTTVKAQNLMQGVKQQKVDVSNAVTQNFIRAAQKFSINLFKQSANSGENTLVSPNSAYLTLGMTANGASGPTLNAFKKVLGNNQLTLDGMNKGCKAYEDELTGKRGNTSLGISNSIWYRNGFKANKDFLQKNADYFAAGANTLNFDSRNSVNTINRWVQEHTENRIDKIIDRIDPQSVMYLINAISFDAKWQKPFDTTEKARQGAFYLKNGNTQQATYMSLEDRLAYIKGPNESAVLLPYDDGRFAFLCILPDSGIDLDNYVKSMTETTIPNLMNEASQTDIAVNLPEFSASSNLQLNDTLKKLGLDAAFDKNKADFSKMSANNKKQLYISEAHQKTCLKVNELGTEAGAAACVEMQKAAAVPYIIFNRPFIYAVIDTQTNLPLFLGTLQNPNP